ncbi:AmmeMemoRadiSam system protein A [Inmirania thermothiophila]|uniref:AMMECR1 domain-containing protein n=1 Tax=Inmirania thermothiophila TaxID=1750597 RepID=A0A3N1Y231_9GAMM|nr:AmmeMemoRadiSam system protein A [Inmirania thermothiophila]ROR32895.1 hypothetical protein EDC57_2110 [Inmirania thermothiophila]
MPSTDGRLGTRERDVLLGIAQASIRHGLERGTPLPVRAPDYEGALREPGASFVTLKRGGALRGCIGSLEARRPLVEDVAANAFAAAFEDPRFPPLAPEELEDLAVSVSVLTPPEPLPCASEEELIARLVPGEDGLIIADGAHRATFLPAVWESLPEPRDFLRELRRKAGLPPDHWSPRLRVWRYRTESFGTA